MKGVLNRIMRNVVNIPGWSTKRHIVVIESDDWGSTRVRSNEDTLSLEKVGFDFSKTSFYQYDALESNNDVSDLLEVLSKYKDYKGNYPVFTLACNVANPDYERIKANDYREYYWESFVKTLDRYPNHNQVYELEKEGIRLGMFRPVFHGREHLNVLQWMNYLQSGNKSVLLAAEHGLFSVITDINGNKLAELPAAFDINSLEDLGYLRSTIEEGLAEFQRLWNMNARYFIIPNGPFNKSLEKDFMEHGVDIIVGPRKQKEVLGDGLTKTHYQTFGMKNSLGQIYLTRNASLEPGIIEGNLNVNCLENALLSVERSFRWFKPAIISSHRINYLGYLNPKNKDLGLSVLDMFLKKILKRWPDVEFMSSVELGDLILKRE